MKQAGYARADLVCGEDKQKRTVKQILKRHLPAAIAAVDSDGEVHQLLKYDEVMAALVEAGCKWAKPKEDDQTGVRSQEPEVSPEERAVQAAKAQREWGCAQAVQDAQMGAVTHALAERSLDLKARHAAFLKLLGWMDDADSLNAEVIARRRGWDMQEAHFLDHAEKLDVFDLFALLAEAFCTENYQPDYQDSFIEQLAEITGVKLDKIGKTARAEFEKAHTAKVAREAITERIAKGDIHPGQIPIPALAAIDRRSVKKKPSKPTKKQKTKAKK